MSFMSSFAAIVKIQWPQQGVWLGAETSLVGCGGSTNVSSHERQRQWFLSHLQRNTPAPLAQSITIQSLTLYTRRGTKRPQHQTNNKRYLYLIEQSLKIWRHSTGSSRAEAQKQRSEGVSSQTYPRKMPINCLVAPVAAKSRVISSSSLPFQL